MAILGTQDADFVLVAKDNVAIERDTSSIRELIPGIAVHMKMVEFAIPKAVSLSPANGHALSSEQHATHAMQLQWGLPESLPAHVHDPREL